MRYAPAEFYSLVRWKGSRPGAIRALIAAIETNPYSPDFHRNLASLLYEEGDIPGAEREIHISHMIAPKHPAVLMLNANQDTN